MCYAHHCHMTTTAVVEALGLPEDRWSLSYQSRLGPVKWLTPASTSAVVDLAKRGVTNVAVVARPSWWTASKPWKNSKSNSVRPSWKQAGRSSAWSRA